MVAPSAPREATCLACSARIPAGRRGPLPRRCRACRRRPLLAARTSGKFDCLDCGQPVSVRGRRGRLPQRCPACRSEEARRRRRLVMATLDSLTPEDWVALRMPDELRW